MRDIEQGQGVIRRFESIIFNTPQGVKVTALKLAHDEIIPLWEFLERNGRQSVSLSRFTELCYEGKHTFCGVRLKVVMLCA